MADPSQIVCIGEVTVMADITYRVPSIFVPDPSNILDDFLSIRLKYLGGPAVADLTLEDKPRTKRRPTTQLTETIQVLTLKHTGSSGEHVSAEEFGLVTPRFASVIGPLMAKNLIRFQTSMKPVTVEATVCCLQALIFTAREDLRIVIEHLGAGALALVHPSKPYNSVVHQDRPYLDPSKFLASIMDHVDQPENTTSEGRDLSMSEPCPPNPNTDHSDNVEKTKIEFGLFFLKSSRHHMYSD